MAPKDPQRSASGPAKAIRRTIQTRRRRPLGRRPRGATRLALELGISQWNLRDWRRLFCTGGPKAASSPAKAPAAGGTVEQAVELADLRRELEAVKRQRDI